MKFCYCDESGTGNEPIAVMAGVIVDAQRMHKTKVDWKKLLEDLSRIAGKRIVEFHTRDFYPGNGLWRGINGETRARIITNILQWLNERRHDVIFSAIVKSKFNDELNIGKIPREIQSIWQCLGFHLVLGIQKEHQKMNGTKGHTLLIFDHEVINRTDFTSLILNPPAWNDSFYSKRRKQDRLDQIIDVPYWADSQHVGLIQLADFLAFFIRRYAEIKEKIDDVRYPGEDEKLDEWFDLISTRQISRSCLYPARGRCEVANLFWDIAPNCIKQYNSSKLHENMPVIARSWSERR